MVGKIDWRITRRIGVEIDPQRTFGSAVVNRDREILDRSERKVMCVNAISSKVEIVFERHDIQAWPKQRLAACVAAQIAAQIRKLIVLALQNLCHPARRVLNRVRHRHAGME